MPRPILLEGSPGNPPTHISPPTHPPITASTSFQPPRSPLPSHNPPIHPPTHPPSPGVGKSTLIEALAQAAGYTLTRINLSEQTDLSDLLGADLPVSSPPEEEEEEEEGEGGGSHPAFAWQDGPLLSALRDGHWVLLDELNLASQAVLEGLNSLLDHRGYVPPTHPPTSSCFLLFLHPSTHPPIHPPTSPNREVYLPELNRTFSCSSSSHPPTHPPLPTHSEVYLPELNRTFSCSSSFRVFAAQNPLGQGGGRKGLPQSFLNRFTKVRRQPTHPPTLPPNP